MEVVLVRSRSTRGVLMVFHGCMRRPTDWWHYEPTCVTCTGEAASATLQVVCSVPKCALVPAMPFLHPTGSGPRRREGCATCISPMHCHLQQC